MKQVDASIILKKSVVDLDKADDWFEKVKELLEGKTACTMRAYSSNHEEKVELTDESDPT